MVGFREARKQYAHTAGHTVVSYTADHIVTGGSDGVIQILSIAPNNGQPLDKDPVFISRHTRPITTISVQGDVIATGSEDKTSCSFSLSSGEHLSLITQCHEAIRFVALSKDGKKCAVASDETSIKLVNMQDTLDATALEGHTSPVRSLAFHPKGDYLVSVARDGAVNVWDTRLEEPTCLKSFADIAGPGDTISGRHCTPAWHPTGSIFAVPGRDGDIVLIERDTWETLFTLQNGHSKEVTSLAWSPNGLYILSVSLDNKLVIWNADTRVSILSETHTNRVTGISWHPTLNSVALTDSSGELLVWEEPIISKHPHPTRPTHTSLPKAAPSKDAATTAEKSTTKAKTVAEKPRKKVAAIPDTYDEIGAIDLGSDEGDDKFVVDDDGAGVPNCTNNRASTTFPAGCFTSKEWTSLFRQEVTAVADQTDNFINVPSSPAFNTRGIVYTVEQTVHSTIYVEFHDKGQRSFNFQDYSNFAMACLGDRGALFAVEGTSNIPSRVEYRSFDSWGMNPDWHFAATGLENITAIALTDHGAAVSTDSRYLRFFSHSGVQTGIECMKGPVVAMAGFGDWLFVVYHAGPAFGEDQRLAYELYDFSLGRSVDEKLLFLSPGAVLEWIGFSESGLPATYDSVGILRMLDISDTLKWMPYLDTRATRVGNQETYWAIGVTDTDFLCAIIKGAEKHPHFPKPLLHEIPLQMPLFQLDGPSGPLEEKYLRASLFAKHYKNDAERKEELPMRENDLHKRKVDMDKTLLQLIQLSCAGERMTRALDLCTMLQLPRSVDGAIKLAVHHHMPALAERMNLIKEAKMIKQKEDEEDMSERRARSLQYQSLIIQTESDFAKSLSRQDDWKPPVKRTDSNGPRLGGMVGLRDERAVRKPGVDYETRDNASDKGDSRSSREASFEPEKPIEKPKPRNPFALAAGTSAPTKPVPVSANALFASINQIAAPKSKAEKDEATHGANKKRKPAAVNQTKLFGAAPANKEHDGDEDSNEKRRKVAKSNAVPTKNTSITSFLQPEGAKPKEPAPKAIPQDDDTSLDDALKMLEEDDKMLEEDDDHVTKDLDVTDEDHMQTDETGEEEQVAPVEKSKAPASSKLAAFKFGGK
ncbi:hypothetical protein SmJEL517_g02056 [Synchytrium microbalum]|uniref:Uncharacterized protein n=1 Tax=Synchytrium microbalum TaxID=1806994 RepID=A0A507C1R3_9FUNG|nr:uncharacterized protein SmJEL517_g02056 [Synchytrium microbalum]TPX35470.1 hypothetical protein SmJEL517_g02056 [Synchytrium microbalum]